MERRTVSCFYSLIYLGNLFCINRSYLILNRRRRIFGNIICIFSFSIITILFVNDIVVSFKRNYEKMFRAVLVAESLILAIAARYRKVSFTALERLDEKCGVDEQYTDRLKAKTNKETVLGVISMVIDISGLYFLGAKPVDILSYTIVFAAHEAETIFFALIIEGINLRLLKLSRDNPSSGSRVYRHVLIAASQMNVEFTPRILLLLAVILITTITYSCIILLKFSEIGVYVAVYFLCRELKSMYCLWRLCKVSSESDTTCQQLAFELAKKLAFDPAFDRGNNPHAYSIVKRWYCCILQHRPRYVRGSTLSVNLSVPLHIIDISINYVLIIIQIYGAYK